MQTSAVECNLFLQKWSKISAAKAGDAAVFSAEGTKWKTFGDLNREAEAWAERFSRLGLRPRVVIQLPNGPEWISVFLGIWMCGGIVLPVESGWEEAAVTELGNLCGVDGVVKLSAAGHAELFSLENSQPAETWEGVDLFKATSGTTSRRRLIAFSAVQWLADVENLSVSMGLRESDRNFGIISFAHSYGLSNLVGMVLGRGIPVVPFQDVLPRAMSTALRESGATILPAVPAMFRALAGTGFLSPSLRLCISAGAPLPAPLAREFRELTGNKIHSFYGASECGGIAYDASPDPQVPEGFVGEAVANVTLTKLETTGSFKVRVSGPQVGGGYVPAGDGDPLENGVFFPSDLLEEVAGGFRITGRESDFINVGGRKVNPSEIEAVLRSHPGVGDCVVFGIPERGARGERIAACIAGDDREESLRNHCATRLPTWQVPKRWIFVSALPVNERGKISRPALARQYSQD